MKIFYRTEMPSLTLRWTIMRGKSHVMEEIPNNMKLWLVSSTDRIPLSWTLDEGVIVADLPSDLTSDSYGFKAVWIKNTSSFFCRGSVNVCEEYGVFGVTDYLVDATYDGDSEHVTIKVVSPEFGYAKDGLSAYELAVLKGETTLTESEWVLDNATMQANEAERQSTWEAQSAEVEDAIHDAGLATSAATAAAANAEQARQNILTTWGNDSTGLKHDVQAATVSATTAASAASGAASAATTAASSANSAASSATSAAASAASAATNANQKATLANTAATAASAAAASAEEAADEWTDTYKPQIEEALEAVEGFEADLAAETSRATSAEGVLQDLIEGNTENISYIAEDLNDEINNRLTAEQGLVKNIKINGVAVEKDGQNAILPTASADGTKAGVVAVGAGNGLHMSTGHIILSAVTSDTNGAMLATDKVKLDSLQSGTNYYTKSQVDSAIAAIHQFEQVQTGTLPTASASTMHKLYCLVDMETGTNRTTEYITIEESGAYRWEQVGASKDDLNTKVDKVSGKGLSTNDYTNADKNKVDNYTLIPYDFAEDWGEREETEARIAEIEGIIAGRLDTMALILYDGKYHVSNIVEINDHYHEFYFVTSIDGKPYQVCAQIAYGWWKNVNRSQIATSSDVSLALTHKQDTLVSGTNIKTINSQSILGSGNIEIQSGGGTWGSITGDLEDQEDLQEELNKKSNFEVVASTEPTSPFAILKPSDIIDNVTTSDATKVLSAKQGKVLNDALSDKQANATFTTETGTTATIAVSASQSKNETHKYGTLASLTISSIAESPYEVVVIFDSGATATTLSLPASYKSVGTISVAANKSYVLSIKDGIVICSELTSNSN